MKVKKKYFSLERSFFVVAVFLTMPANIYMYEIKKLIKEIVSEIEKRIAYGRPLLVYVIQVVRGFLIYIIIEPIGK